MIHWKCTSNATYMGCCLLFNRLCNMIYSFLCSHYFCHHAMLLPTCSCVNSDHILFHGSASHSFTHIISSKLCQNSQITSIKKSCLIITPVSEISHRFWCCLLNFMLTRHQNRTGFCPSKTYVKTNIMSKTDIEAQELKQSSGIQGKATVIFANSCQKWL